MIRISTPGNALGAHEPVEPALPGAPVFLPNPRRILWPTALSAVLLAGALFPLPALRDALNGLAFDGGRLSFTTGYIWFSPFFDLLDAISVLTLQQHYGFAASLILGWLVLRLRKWVRSTDAVRWLREGVAFLSVLGMIVGLYAVAILVPRFLRVILVLDLVKAVNGRFFVLHPLMTGN